MIKHNKKNRLKTMEIRISPPMPPETVPMKKRSSWKVKQILLHFFFVRCVRCAMEGQKKNATNKNKQKK